jgi:dATP pyrophosphohydrolase
VFVGFIDTEQEVHLSREHSEYRWITADEADDFLAFQQQKEMFKTIESSICSAYTESDA